MKKIRLSNEQMQRVIGLREGGASWVGIQKETGIARQIAKRQYDEWYRSQSQRQLDDARKSVVAQEYRVHLDLLSRIANLLLNSLVIPHPLSDIRKADEVASSFLSQDIYRNGLSLGLPSEGGQRAGLVGRMNDLVFKSLREHTQGKVPWKALDEWKDSRDSCVLRIEKLRVKINEVLAGIVKQEARLGARIERAKGDVALQQTIPTGILLYLWTNDILGREGEVTPFRGESVVRKGTAWVSFHNALPEQTNLIFSTENQDDNEELAKEVVRIANWVIENVRESETALFGRVKNEIERMGDAASTLEAALNPLVLRPLILSTKCDICPV